MLSKTVSEEIRNMLRMPAVNPVPKAIRAADRIEPHELPKPSSEAAKRGLRFQAQVGKALARAATSIGARLDVEPWFRYQSDGDAWQWIMGCAVPDFIFTFGDQQLVIEVKLTFVLDAPQKLTKLYVPVVAKAYGLRPRPLVIARHLTSQAADYPRVETLAEALRTEPEADVPVLHYLGIGGIPWAHAQPMVRSSKPEVL